LDSAGNSTAKTDLLASSTSNYTYDPIYQLTTVTQANNTTESYSYDAVGNRTASLGVSSYTTNASNELTATSNASYTYDSNGNTLTKTVGSNTTSYTWDFENRLTSVTLPGSGGTVSFKYDPLGRRIEKVSPTFTSIFAYDGDNLIETTNSIGTVVARYAQTQSIDEPLAELRSSTTSYYEADGLGSITSLTNAAGAVANTYTYDSYGNLTASSASVSNPFSYTGREFDSETGLYFYRARYYDPTVGRFLNEDPTGFRGGINFYGCVDNNPINRTDPDGTGWMDCARALADLARATSNLERDLRNIPKGACPTPKHLKELRQRQVDLQNAYDKVLKHCGKYAGAAAAIAAAARILAEVAPYIEFAGEAALAL
jgi:RHS repeat-associated protein